MLKPWDEIPDDMRTEAVMPYYDVLSRHRGTLALKRVFDFTVSLIMLIVLLPLMLLIAAAVRIDTPGCVLFFQERVTSYGRRFKIWKFRTMYANADKSGTQVTVSNDRRITRVGQFLRKYRLDARRSNQSILKEISPGISLEGMILKLKLQYFGHQRP